MVDNQVYRNLRIDLLRIATGAGDGVAHGSQVDDGRNAGEILHQDPGRTESDFMIGTMFFQPTCHRVDILCCNRIAILITQQVFQQHLKRQRQAVDITVLTGIFSNTEVLVDGSADLQVFSCLETIQAIFTHEHSLFLCFQSLTKKYRKQFIINSQNHYTT